jgi:hypothetical protein
MGTARGAGVLARGLHGVVGHSGEVNMRGERRPGHAGPLAAWERLAIAAILAIMAAVVIALAVS